MYSVRHSKSLTADADISVGCGGVTGAEVISGRNFYSSTRAFSALLYCVQLGGNLLRRESKNIVHDGEPSHCWAAVRRIGVAGDELRGASAVGAASWAEIRQSIDHHRADWSSVSGGAADSVGDAEMGACEIGVAPPGL